MSRVIKIHGFQTKGDIRVVVKDGNGTQLGKREAPHLGVALERVVKDFEKAYGVKKLLTHAEIQHLGTMSAFSRLVSSGMSFCYWREGNENLSLLYITTTASEIKMDVMLESLIETAPHINISGVCSGDSGIFRYKIKRVADRSLLVLSGPLGSNEDSEAGYVGIGKTFREAVEGVTKIIPKKK